MRNQPVKSHARRTVLLLGAGLPFFRLSRATEDSPVTLDQLAGEYTAGSSLKARLIVRADGRFDWKTDYVMTGSDMVGRVSASGRLVPDGGAFAAHLDSTAVAYPPGLFPPRLHAVRTSKFIVLLGDETVNGIINAINGRGWRTGDVSGMLHRLLPGATDGDAKNIDRALLIPKTFSNRILAAPLRGKVLGVEEVSAGKINVAQPMMPPVLRMSHASRLTVDLGSRQGVFEDMTLYVAGESRRRMGTVKRVMADRCEIDFEWYEEDPPPQVGDSVFSSERDS